MFAALGTKLKILKNKQLKEAGVFLFLRGKSHKTIQKAARKFANEIKLNSIYKSDFLNTESSKRMIISASFEIYLKELFPDEKIIATRLEFRNDKVIGLKKNIYGMQKKRMIENMGIKEIECLYTDSYSDRPLMEVSKQICLINNGTKKKIQK